MTRVSLRRLRREADWFLAYKRSLGHPYQRGAWTLRSFFRHAQGAAHRSGRVDLPSSLRAWLSRAADRKPVSVTVDLGVIRQFCLFRRRSDPHAFVPDRTWAPQSTESSFLPRVLSDHEVRRLLQLATTVRHPIRAATLRTLLLMLYCTGLRPGEAVRLTLADVDLKTRALMIRESKGKTRIVPFGDDLGAVITAYLQTRAQVAPSAVSGPLLVRPDGTAVPMGVASTAIRRLFRHVGIKPLKGRTGPRPYDLRHTFAVHRLTAWHRDGIDVHTRLAWLSTFMGHDDLLGTETYLTATPELLALAADRFERRYRGGPGHEPTR